MSGNGSRVRTKEYGTTGPLLPTPRPCSGLRSSGANQTELLMSAERLTSSREVSPANPSLSPGSAWARKMTAISGRTLLRSLPISGPLGACLRTLLDTSRWGSTACWLTWKRSATPAGRLLYRLVPSTPRTGETGFGLWPTPNVQSLNNRQEYATAGGDGLQTAVRRDAGILEPTETVPVMWPTPRTEGFDAGGHRGSPDSLHSAVKLFPTHRATSEHWSDVEIARLSGQQRAAMKANGTPHTAATDGAKLNPDWVCALMGYPPGWLDLEE